MRGKQAGHKTLYL